MPALDGPDLFHLAQERPDRPTHTLKVAVLDEAVACEEIDRWARTTLCSLELLRNRLGGWPLATPVWVDGGEPDLSYHVRHLAIDAPGDEPALQAALSALCSGVLDRNRPLWRLWHLTGLEGERDALAFQLHHAMADGNASVALWEAIADGGVPPTPSPDTIAPGGATAKAVVAHAARETARFPSQVRRFGAYLRHSRQVERSGEPAVTKAFLGPNTRFNGEPEPEHRCVFVTVPFSRLQAARASTGASINEVFLTVCGGALRRHLEGLGEPPAASLTAAVPAALPERAQPFGNSVTTLYVSLHSDLVDPVARLRAVQRSLAATREASDRDPRLLPDWQRYPRLNRGLIKAMELAERRGGRPAYNVIVSNVRGPRPFSLCGAGIRELRSVGPLAGRLGLNITGWSYGDDFTVGIHTNASAAAQLDALGDRLNDELVQLGRSASTSNQGVPS